MMACVKVYYYHHAFLDGMNGRKRLEYLHACGALCTPWGVYSVGRFGHPHVRGCACAVGASEKAWPIEGVKRTPQPWAWGGSPAGRHVHRVRDDECPEKGRDV